MWKKLLLVGRSALKLSQRYSNGESIFKLQRFSSLGTVLGHVGSLLALEMQRAFPKIPSPFINVLGGASYGPILPYLRDMYLGDSDADDGESTMESLSGLDYWRECGVRLDSLRYYTVVSSQSNHGGQCEMAQ
jgi:hypothetical protein